VRYFVRVALGALLGLLAVGALAFFGVRWWIGAVAGALLAAVGFLGSFFLWSADRPEEGYEQVLFDLPNNVVSVALVVVLVGLAFGAPHLLHKGSAAPVDPAIADMNAQHDALTKVYNDLVAAKLDRAGVDAAKASVAAAKLDLGNLTASDNSKTLLAAANGEGPALDAYVGCGYKACQAVQLSLIDVKAALNKYVPG